jgi:hypothetical protein
VTSAAFSLGSVNRGDLLTGWFLQSNASGQVRVSDNLNGTWTRSVAEPFRGTHGDVALYYLANAKAGTTTLTITAPAATYIQGTASEYRGVATSNPLVTAARAKGTGTAASSGATGSVPAGDLVYGALQTGKAPGSVTAGSSQGVQFTTRTALANWTDGSEDILSSAAGAQQATLSLGTSTKWFMVGAAFAPAANNASQALSASHLSTGQRSLGPLPAILASVLFSMVLVRRRRILRDRLRLTRAINTLVGRNPLMFR